jgi:outer membrane receptor for ferrienterochelin and colicins
VSGAIQNITSTRPDRATAAPDPEIERLIRGVRLKRGPALKSQLLGIVEKPGSPTFGAMKPMRKTAAAWFLFLVSGSLLAQDILIRIVEEGTGNPVPNASVGWQSVTGPVVKGFTTSGMDGRVRVPAGKKVALSVSCLGYTDYLDTLDAGELAEIRMETDILNLGQVVITGTKTRKTLANTPVLTKVISREEITQMAAATTLEALEFTMPGVRFFPDGHGDNLMIQGLDNNYILVLVDGRRLAGATRGNVDFDRIDEDNIERIEIINGASSVLYGSNAIGAVINIITKSSGKPFEAALGSQYESYGRLRMNASSYFNHNKWGGGITAFNTRSVGYDMTPESSSSFTVRPHTDYSINLQGNYAFNQKTRAEINGTWFRHEIFQPEASPYRNHDLDQNITLGGKISSELSAKNTLQLQASSDMLHSYTVYESDRPDEKDGQTGNVVLKLTDYHDFGEKLSLVGGLEYNYEKSFSATLFSGNVEDEGHTKTAWDMNALAQLDYKILKNLEAILSGRLNYHSRYATHFTPNLSMMYSPGRFKLRGNVSTGYRAPSLRELYYNFDHNGMFWIYGNPDLKPESSFYTSLSGEYTLRTFNANATLYRNAIENKIDYLDIISGDDYEKHLINVGEALLIGVETQASLALLKYLKLQTGYAYTDAEDLATGLQLYGNSKHSATVGLSFQMRSIRAPFSVTLLGRGASSRLLQYAEIESDPGSGEEITHYYREESDPYQVWKISYKQRFRLNDRLFLEATAGLNNIFNYITYGSIVDPGRRFFAGLKFQFY